MVKLTKIRSTIGDVTRLQDAVSIVTDFIQNIFTGPKAQVTVTLDTTPKPVAHGLNQEPRGYSIISQNTGEVIFQPSKHSDPTKFITLQATGAVTATIVFL